MKNIFAKLKQNYQQVALFSSLFLAVLFILFIAVNYDFSPSQKNTAEVGQLPAQNVDAELEKRMGSVTFGVESYASWAKRGGLDSGNNLLDADPDQDSLPNYLEYVYSTDPLKTDTDGDKFTDKQEITNGYDPDAPGDAKPNVEISIAKMNVTAPMVWSQSTDDQNMLKELENGVSHFFHTSAPGQAGNMIISGHSSNYVWAKGNYNHIFKDLDNLQPGDIVNIRTTQANGRVLNFQYKISNKFVTTADDQRIFANTTDPSLTLSTCWPIGTNFRRLIVKGELLR